MAEIRESLDSHGRYSPFFSEIQSYFQDLRTSGGTEAQLRKEWQVSLLQGGSLSFLYSFFFGCVIRRRGGGVAGPFQNRIRLCQSTEEWTDIPSMRDVYL
jgi:hypothetical protein